VLLEKVLLDGLLQLHEFLAKPRSFRYKTCDSKSPRVLSASANRAGGVKVMFHERWGRALLGVLLVASLVAFVGCGKKPSGEKTAENMMEKTLEKATGEKADVNIEGGNVSIKTGNSSMEMKETSEWPADMFSDVPRFTYGVVERVTSGQEGGMTKFNVYIRDVEEGAFEKYGADIKAAGWESQSTMQSDDGGMISAQKGNIALQFIYGKKDKTGVVLAYSMPEE
jgi:hypothetical protein